ncbi:50S ribosomal protein L18 [Fusibacter sp. JL216-2]|uniref:50S ribosomal protein L18 n=1 Tax=Fusibacter sp. JL216-2 TaxID=3071453 RepID=UPI003D33BCE3
MINKQTKNSMRQSRQRRVRSKVLGTTERPRLNVYRSLNNVYAQIIDDTTGTTLVSASTLEADIKSQVSGTGNKEAAKVVGEAVAKRAIEKGIDTVVFDRAGYLYHGRVKELADGARAAGLKF